LLALEPGRLPVFGAWNWLENRFAQFLARIWEKAAEGYLAARRPQRAIQRNAGRGKIGAAFPTKMAAHLVNLQNMRNIATKRLSTVWWIFSSRAKTSDERFQPGSTGGLPMQW
jgi:hypothetical protein